MSIPLWGLGVYLSSLAKADPTERRSYALLTLLLCALVAFLVGVLVGSLVIGLAAFVVLAAVLGVIVWRARRV